MPWPNSWYERQELLQHGQSKIPWLCCKWNTYTAVWNTQNVYFKTKYNPVRNIIYSPFSWRRATSTKIVRFEKNFGFIQTWRCNTWLHDPSSLTFLPKHKKNKTLSWVDLTFEWYDNAMVFLVFILNYFFVCLETMVRKDIGMKTISITVLVISLKSYSESLLDHSCL